VHELPDPLEVALRRTDGQAGPLQQTAEALAQDFYFPGSPEFPQGCAVDLAVSSDNQGFWVLTDFGGIYRAGSTKRAEDPALVPGTDRSGVLGVDVSFGSLRDPGLPEPGGASLRAVTFAAIDIDKNSRAEGYVVLDSQGGRLYFNPDGTPVTPGLYAGVPTNDPRHLLDAESYVWPFFEGLDIARDMELHQSQEGVVVLDGWGGIHPVPVDLESNPVFFANNRVSQEDPTPISMVGMPYITAGADDLAGNPDPDWANDATSIFADLEFTTCEGGFYTLDKFGGVFAFGKARPEDGALTPNFGGGPYFFPFLYAVDMEVFAHDETGVEEETETLRGYSENRLVLPCWSWK